MPSIEELLIGAGASMFVTGLLSIAIGQFLLWF